MSSTKKRDIKSKEKKIVKHLENLSLQEAVSYTTHSRIFEILGYLSIIDKSSFSDEDLVYLEKINSLCRTLIEEIDTIINH